MILAVIDVEEAGDTTSSRVRRIGGGEEGMPCGAMR